MSIARASLAKRRTQEKIVREREAYIKENFKAERVSEWEHRTLHRIENQDICNRVKKIAENENQNLQERRRKIEELYERESAAWKLKIDALYQNNADNRINQLREKAYRLKESRENQRKIFVKQCYDRQWREACDDIRSIDSRAITEKLMSDRKYHVENKETKIRSSDVNKMKQEMISNIKELESKERMEKEMRAKKNFQLKLTLDEQVKTIKAKDHAANEERRLEEIQQLRRWREEEIELKRKERNAIELARVQGEQILKAKEAQNEMRQREISKERLEDQVLLKYAIDEEKQDINRVEQEKQKLKELSKEYLIISQEQKRKDQQDENHINSIRDAEIKKQWLAKENEIRQQEDEYKARMLSINQSRLDQIKEKNLKLQVAKEELAQQMALDERTRVKQADHENAKTQLASATTEDVILTNKAMRDLNQQEGLREKQETYLLQKQITFEEEQHRKRFETEAGKVQSYHPLKHTKWYS